MKQNEELLSRKLELPILALGGDGGSAPNIYSAMQPLGEDVRGGVIANSGHYIPEEQPEALAASCWISLELFESQTAVYF